MSGFGETLHTELFGESHASEIGCRVTGLPSGFKLDRQELGRFLARRAPGRDSTSTTRREADIPIFRSGISHGRLTGGPLTAVIANTDVRPNDYWCGAKRITVPRPGHADFGAWIKYGEIPTGGGKWSGRLTAPLCIAGGIAKQILAARGVAITARAVIIGGEVNPAKFESIITDARAVGDSVGGVVEFKVSGLPAGIGDASFDGLESKFAEGLYGIPAVKGVSFGAGFSFGLLRGSQANDPFVIRDGRVSTATNNCGGLLGGITTGEPVMGHVVFKPTPSIAIEQNSVDLETLKPTRITVKGRHDPCVVLRAVPVVEAVCALATLDALLTAERANGELTFGRIEDLSVRLRGSYAKIAVVSDSNVWPLHGTRMKAVLRRTGAKVETFVFPAGEASKNLDTLGQLLTFLAEKRLTRTDAVVALGGGVTGDLAGFAAAIYLRGIEVIQVPTTLLAAVDSSVGGKTGVDLAVGKNLVGAFHFPQLTLIDVSLLKTLPEREYRCGMAEAIKCAVLAGFPDLGGPVGIVGAEPEKIIRACTEFKRRIVAEDPYESGVRRLLNLGHTFGHAVEKLSDYTIPHGEAVAIGLALIAEKCTARGLCEVKTARIIRKALAAAGLPTRSPFTDEELAHAAAGDKKASGKVLRLVVPRAIGKCETISVPRDLSDWI